MCITPTFVMEEVGPLASVCGVTLVMVCAPGGRATLIVCTPPAVDTCMVCTLLAPMAPRTPPTCKKQNKA